MALARDMKIILDRQAERIAREMATQRQKFEAHLEEVLETSIAQVRKAWTETLSDDLVDELEAQLRASIKANVEALKRPRS